jgi:hypothetical protein
MAPLVTRSSFLAAVVATGVAGIAAPAYADPKDGAVVVHEFDPKTGAAIAGSGPGGHPLTYLNIGPYGSLIDSNALVYAIGLEASLFHYREMRAVPMGYGLFAQVQLQNARYFRGAAGIEGSIGPVGVELGLGVRQGDQTYTTTLSPHLGVYISAGLVFLELRFSPQLLAIPTNQPGFGFETAASVGLKLPIVVQGRDTTGLAIQAAKAD